MTFKELLTYTGKTMREIRGFVRNVLKEHAEKEHLCISGDYVPVESQECYDDVCKRIEDARATRNLCSMRSDSRDHYNGILKVLRRKYRKAKKYIISLNN